MLDNSGNVSYCSQLVPKRWLIFVSTCTVTFWVSMLELIGIDRSAKLGTQRNFRVQNVWGSTRPPKFAKLRRFDLLIFA